MSFFIPLTNSELTVEVSEEDHLYLLLLGIWYSCSGYGRLTNHPQEYLHHIVARRMGLIITHEVDHIDRNTFNSKRENLRLATQNLQTINQKLRCGSTSGHKNIVWCFRRNRWDVQIRRDGKLTRIGRFKTLDEAIRQRDAFIKRNNLTFVE